MEPMKLKSTKELALIHSLEIRTEYEEARNPFTNEAIMLCPQAVALFDFIIGMQVVHMDEDKPYSAHDIEQFSTAKDIFRRNWPKEYMILLD